LKTENLSTLKIHKLTQTQYERELAAGNIDENALYLTPDEEIDLSPYATVEQLNTHNTDTDVHANMGWLTSEDETVGTPALINADTLGGRNASYFAKQEDVDELVEQCNASTHYYSTTRDELDVSHENLNTDYIISLYDALMVKYPNFVQKKEVYNDDKTFVNYVYEISTGEYNTKGLYGEVYGTDAHIKKQKYLILNSIHGNERKTTISTYRFICDVLMGSNIPNSFKEGAMICVMPVGNPSGFNAFTRENDNAVDINRNFGSETPEKETQAISNWLSANLDATLFIDVHNSSNVNEVAVILGVPNNDIVDVIKTTALQGIGRIIPFWRDVIGYPPVEAPYFEGNEIKTKVSDVIFSYSANIDIEGLALVHAINELGIPSIGIELVCYYGDYSDYLNNKSVYQPEVLAAGSEVLGNVLLEIYEQSLLSEVIDDMTQIDNKLDVIMESINSGFHTESGVMSVSEDVLPDAGKSSITIEIPCSNGAKLLVFYADDDTFNAIKSCVGTNYTASFIGNSFMPQFRNQLNATVSTQQMLKYDEEMLKYPTLANNGWLVDMGSVSGYSNTNGYTFTVRALKAGNYHWTAYYWND
jgi:hypothetical protein